MRRSSRAPRLAWTVCALISLASSLRADEIELLSGVRFTCVVVQETPQSIRIRVGGAEREFPLSAVHAVTVGEVRRVVNEKPSRRPAPSPADESPANAPAPRGEAPERPVTDARTLIRQAGNSNPDWWDQVQMAHPQTLDLAWRPVKGWKPNESIDTYTWAVVSNNPRLWKPSIKLYHTLLEMHAADADKAKRCRTELGRLYSLIEDYARGAYWYEQAGVAGNGDDPLGLARCYGRLGDTARAEALMARVNSDTTEYGKIIRLWGELGRADKALSLAEASARAGSARGAWLGAAAVCRREGDHARALDFFQRAADLPFRGRGEDRQGAMARDGMEAMKAAQGFDLARAADGVYAGSARGFRDNVEVEVSIQGGRVASVRILRHKEDRVFNAIQDLPGRVVGKQGVAGVDGVTGATATAEAVLNAAAKALGKAKR